MASYMAEYGQKLLDNGFLIVPIAPREKAPSRIDNRGGWINLAWERYKASPPNPATVRMWGGWPECGIGIICGDVVAVDIDLDDEVLSDRAYAIFNRMLGVTPAVRIGRPPRRLLAYRTETPFRKISAGPIEVLADGQQFVGYGIHPAGHEYRWVGERLDEMSLVDLPLVTEAQVRAAVAAVLEDLPEEVTKGARIAQGALDLPPGATGHETSIHGLVGDPEGIAAALEALPNDDLSWDRWNDVGMAIFNALGPGGFDQFDTWSRKSVAKYGASKSETTRLRWASYLRSPPKSIGAGSIYFLAEETGWRLDPSINKYPQPDIPQANFSALLRPPAGQHEPDVEAEPEDEDVKAEPRVDFDRELPDDFTRGDGLLFRLVDWICSTAPSPNRPLALGAAIVTIGTIIGRRLVGPTRLGPHMMLLCLAGTGVGKDHPQRSVQNILRAIGMKEAIGPGDLMSSSAVYSLLSNRPLCVCCIDEYGDFLRKISNPRSPATNGIMRVLKECYSVNLNYTNSVEWAAKSGDSIYFPAMSIYGLSTFEQFFDAISGKEIKDGFINRHLLIATRIRAEATVDFELDHATPPPYLLDDLSFLRGKRASDGNLGDALTQSATQEVSTVMIPWSVDGSGRACWDDLQAHLRPLTLSETHAEHWQRTGENALKLALIHAASRLPETLEITAADMEWAGSLAIWSTQQMIACADEFMSENDNQRDFKKVRGVIERHAKKGVISHSDLLRHLNGTYKTSQIKEIVDTLAGAQKINVEKRKPKGGGREATYYRLR